MQLGRVEGIAGRAVAMALRRAMTSSSRTVAIAAWRAASTEAAALAQESAQAAGVDEAFGHNSKPRSLSLPSDSKLRYIEPHPGGFKGILLKVLGFYSGQSRRIRGAKWLYARIKSQVDKPELYSSFGLEKNFRTTHAMLVLHVWLCLVRLRAEEKGEEIGQALYEVFNHDLEMRMADAGVKISLLISKWMKQLEKNFYGAVMVYDTAMQPSAKQDDLARALWRNVFAEDDSPMPSGPALANVQALANYIRRQTASLALTESEDFLTGNIGFSRDFGDLAASSRD